MSNKEHKTNKKQIQENLLFIGSDSELNLYYIEIPEIFIPYKNNLENIIKSTFYNSFSNIVPRTFLANMKSRDVLHKFIEKHTTNLFSSISTEEELELIIQEECKKIFNITNESDFNKLYKRYDKGNSIEIYAFNLYKEKLLDYKERLDKIEL